MQRKLWQFVGGGALVLFVLVYAIVALVPTMAQEQKGNDGGKGSTGRTVVIKEYEKQYDPFGNGNTIPIYYVADSVAMTPADAREFQYAPLFGFLRGDDGGVRLTRGSGVDDEWFLEVILDDFELQRVVVEHLRQKLGRQIRSEDVSVLDVGELEVTADATTLALCPGFAFYDNRILNKTVRIRFRASEDECAALRTRLNDGSASMYFTFRYMVDASHRATQTVTGRAVLETALFYHFMQAGQTRVLVTRGQALDFANTVTTEISRKVVVQNSRDLKLLTEVTANQLLKEERKPVVSVPDFPTVVRDLSSYKFNANDPYLTPAKFEETVASKLREVNSRTDEQTRQIVKDIPWGWKLLFPSLRTEKSKELSQEIEKDFETRRTESGVEIIGIRLFEVDVTQWTDQLVFQELVVIEQRAEKESRVERIVRGAVAIEESLQQKLPVGTIVVWDPLVRDENGSSRFDSTTHELVTRPIPTGWRICDGTGGTPNLRDRFVYGSTADNESKNYADVWFANGNPTTGVGGNLTHNHSFVHSHQVNNGSGGSEANGTGKKLADADHNHGATSVTTEQQRTSTESSLPPYVKLVYIMKVR